jgi:hypothetical protein
VPTNSGKYKEEKIMGYRAWRNVKKDLDKANRKRRKAYHKMMKDALKHSRIDPMLKIEYVLAEEDFWKCDQEALYYNAYTKWPPKRRRVRG